MCIVFVLYLVEIVCCCFIEKKLVPNWHIVQHELVFEPGTILTHIYKTLSFLCNIISNTLRLFNFTFTAKMVKVNTKTGNFLNK